MRLILSFLLSLFLYASIYEAAPVMYIMPEIVNLSAKEGTEAEAPQLSILQPTPSSTVDLDKDGQISLQEVQYAGFVHHGLSGSVIEQLFNQVDENKDGQLSTQEFDNIRPLVLAKAEHAAQRYLQSVDTDGDGLLSLREAQVYLLREYGIGTRDVERIWKLVVPTTDTLMGPSLFSKLRRRIRGMTIRLARQIMKSADTDHDGHISLSEAQAVAFEQEGIGAEDVAAMLASVDDNEDGEMNAPEFADFERIVRARAVETSKRALKVVDADGSGTLTLEEAKRIAFEHYGFDESVLAPFFAQADENEDGQLDAVEFAGFRSVIRSRAVKDAMDAMPEVDIDEDGLVSVSEAEEKTRKEDDMEPAETRALFYIADQNKSGKLDRVELADFIRLVRLSAIKFATDHFGEFDANRDGMVTEDELTELITEKYEVPKTDAVAIFKKVDVDSSGELIPAEIVDYRHEIREYVRQREAANGKAVPFTTKSEVFVVTEQATSSALPDASRQTTLSTSTLLPTETQSFTTSFVKTAPLNILPDVPPSEIPRLVETTPQRPFPETTPRPASTTTACTTSPPKKAEAAPAATSPNEFAIDAAPSLENIDRPLQLLVHSLEDQVDEVQQEELTTMSWRISNSSEVFDEVRASEEVHEYETTQATNGETQSASDGTMDYILHDSLGFSATVNPADDTDEIIAAVQSDEEEQLRIIDLRRKKLEKSLAAAQSTVGNIGSTVESAEETTQSMVQDAKRSTVRIVREVERTTTMKTTDYSPSGTRILFSLI